MVTVKWGGQNEDKPPPVKNDLCISSPNRICFGSNNRGFTRGGTLGALRYISSPMLASRLRNDLAILETH